jgi:hypothetical protein
MKKREEYLCNDLVYANAFIAESCGYSKVFKILEKRTSVHNKKRKIFGRLLVRRNANKFAHEKK